MDGYVEKKTLEAALNAGAAADSDSRRRAWVKAICILHDIPAADVAPVVHGRWEQENNPFDDSIWVCSVCNEPFSIICGTPEENSMNYCPNCGAKMDG